MLTRTMIRGSRLSFIFALLVTITYVILSSSSIPLPEVATPPVHKGGINFETQITVIIKVHKRHDIAVRAAFSVFNQYPHMAILLIDDSPSPITQTLPPTAKYVRIPENTGISYGRNYGVMLINTSYTFIMDDDWLFTNLTLIGKAFQLLDTNDNIGLITGFLCKKDPLDDCYGYQGFVGIVDGYLTYEPRVINSDMGNGCSLVDLGENVILARTRILKQFPWDNQLTNAEHEDFFLSLKGHANVASCNWLKVLHKRPGLGDYKGYFEDRDLSANQDRLCVKWDLRGFKMQYSEWQRNCK